MWSGVPREWVQTWADKNHMQTLSTAMGPLMLKNHGRCLKSTKSKAQWSRYVKVASRIFALYVPKGHEITVLTRPPPNKFHPMGLSTYQSVEEPILKGMQGGEPVSRINLVHLTVADASDFRYQISPEDKTHLWTDRYKLHQLRKHHRRTAKRYVCITPMRCTVSSLETHRAVELRKFESHHEPSRNPTLFSLSSISVPFRPPQSSLRFTPLQWIGDYHSTITDWNARPVTILLATSETTGAVT